MRCAACGYYNLPGSTSCARCGRGAEAPSAVSPSPSFSELYPPRARNRPAWVRLAESVGEQAAALRDRVPFAELRERRMEAARSMRPLAIGSMSLVPGLGQFCQRRFTLGAGMLAGGGVLAFGAVWGLHHRVSDLLLLLLLALIWYSVADAMLADAPAPSRQDDRRRKLRYSLVALCLVTGGVTSSGLVLMPWYTFWQMGASVPGLPFRPGDGLIVRRASRSAALRSGDVVLFRDLHGRETVGTVCALPGQPLPVSTIPVTELLWVEGGEGPGLEVRRTRDVTVVPGGEVAVSVPVMWAGGSGRSIARVRTRELEGWIAGIYSPPERRRWYR